MKLLLSTLTACFALALLAELQAQAKIKTAIRFSAINVTPEGATAVGFTDSSDAKNPVHYYLKAVQRAEARRRVEEEKAQHEAEREEQRAQLMQIQEELRKAREARAAREAEAASTSDAEVE
jgi:hypothetical protein